MYEIRIFYEKLNGETGHLMHRYKAKTSNELLKKWFIHLSDFEGWPYEIYDFDKDEIITDWVYDPDDYIIIGDYFGVLATVYGSGIVSLYGS